MSGRPVRGRSPRAASRRGGSTTHRRTHRSSPARRPATGWHAGSAGRTRRMRVRARLPTIDPTLIPSIAGAIILPRPAIIAAIGSSLASTAGNVARPERGGELGEQRAVGIERLQRPLFRCRHRWFDGWDVELHHVGNVESGDVGQLGVLEPHARVDIRRRHCRRRTRQRAATGCGQQCELASCVPVQRTLAGQRPGEITEHRQAGEGIAGRIATKRVDSIVRIIVVGHDVDATAMIASDALASA